MSRPDRLILDRAPSPIGELLIVTDEHGALRALDFHDHEHRLDRLLRTHYRTLRPESGAAPAAIREAMAAYFAGEFAALRRIAWATNGTAFQHAVWTALTEIPVGETITYSELARRAGRPAAIRAAGHANGSNPLSIVAPCHRVIGMDGSLTGYGGGVERKRWLLAHEGARPL
ncbi:MULTISPECIES: methylated-DNA--[protein]-cysteine S-methyltransferase [unclassified Caulobacter]|uniref:methylated-DNA--[protein]-cysteine S-methyltransferase n=1 Tax=unclassified Caulobacter TaxID=2648921 RepID=UPI0006F692B3|nr:MULTISPECIES: methylated-DNA--[protein]-cysteine S-methyltransferase [unclassified Caulobacter]KQV56322.1 cysteine methyltransferase [Caulobacter sp. Root342]KQV71246.1 cysteine methyltransferase [Caulobacter sp. Root343]